MNQFQCTRRCIQYKGMEHPKKLGKRRFHLKSTKVAGSNLGVNPLFDFIWFDNLMIHRHTPQIPVLAENENYLNLTQ